MADTDQFPKGWKPDKLGKALGGPFVRPHKDKPKASNLDKAIAKDHQTKTATVTAATQTRSKPITPKPKRRR